MDRQRATDLDLHHTAVQLAIEGGAGAKALHKALDERHGAVIKRFGDLRGATALELAWKQALDSGEVPAAYWALLTHPDVTDPLRQQAFGDVHMLSHLVGAANRADIRRLQALDRENADLRDTVARQQDRLQAIHQDHDEKVRALEAELAHLRGRSTVPESTDAPARRTDALERAAALHRARRDAAEREAAELRAECGRLRDAQASLTVRLTDCEAELEATEQSFRGMESVDDDGRPATSPVAGLRIVYVGGRPRSTLAIRAWVHEAGGTLVAHDGGIEDRKGLLAPMLRNADLVTFPVDCIDHASMHLLKQACGQRDIAIVPLRTASVASFLAGLRTVTIATPLASAMRSAT